MKRFLVFAMTVFVLASGCTRLKTVQKTETIMGTEITITVVARSVEEGESAIEAGMAELRRLDAMRLQARAGHRIVPHGEVVPS